MYGMKLTAGCNVCIICSLTMEYSVSLYIQELQLVQYMEQLNVRGQFRIFLLFKVYNCNMC